MLDLVFTNIDCEITVDHDDVPLVKQDSHHLVLCITIEFKSHIEFPLFPTNNNA